MLVLLVGVIQLLAGLFRLGFLIRFVSNAVMTGFLNGVAVLIILGQLSDLTGYQSTFSNRVAQALDLLLRIGQIDLQVDDHRRRDAGADRAVAVAQAIAALRLHHRHCRGDRPAGRADPRRPAHGRALRRGPDGR